MKAWLITWEGTSKKINDDLKIVAILSGRYSGSTIEIICDTIYHRTELNARDSAYYANRKPERYKMNRVSTSCGVCFGKNPFLYGRKVKELKVLQEGGIETISWLEPDEYSFDEKHHWKLKEIGQRRVCKRNALTPLSMEIGA